MQWCFTVYTSLVPRPLLDFQWYMLELDVTLKIGEGLGTRLTECNV